MIKLEPAVDHDQGQNGIIGKEIELLFLSMDWHRSSFSGYSITSATALPFSLRYDLSRGDLSLVIKENLDRERVSSYSFDIIAHDGGNQTGLLHVYLNIDDVNDSPPKFDQSVYTLQNISENLPMNSIVMQVHATDDDQGVNGEITYYLLKYVT